MPFLQIYEHDWLIDIVRLLPSLILRLHWRSRCSSNSDDSGESNTLAAFSDVLVAHFQYLLSVGAFSSLRLQQPRDFRSIMVLFFVNRASHGSSHQSSSLPPSKYRNVTLHAEPQLPLRSPISEQLAEGISTTGKQYCPRAVVAGDVAAARVHQGSLCTFALPLFRHQFGRLRIERSSIMPPPHAGESSIARLAVYLVRWRTKSRKKI